MPGNWCHVIGAEGQSPGRANGGAHRRKARFWRWIRSEERARRFRSLRNGSAVLFPLALWFFDENNKLITLDRASGRTHAVTHSTEQFDNEKNIRF